MSVYVIYAHRLLNIVGVYKICGVKYVDMALDKIVNFYYFITKYNLDTSRFCLYRFDGDNYEGK